MKYLRLVPLATFTLFLVVASVAISVLNWASMPATGIGTLVAASIALGVEGAKLYLVPFCVANWSRLRAQAIAAGTMGAVMTVLSVGGIVVWMDNNLAFNSEQDQAQRFNIELATGENLQALARKEALLTIAKDFTDLGRLTRAQKVIEQADAIHVKAVQAVTVEGHEKIGLVIPFNLSESARWTLLTAIACTIDIGALLLITILMGSLSVERPTTKPQRAVVDVEPEPEFKPEVKCEEEDLSERHLEIFNAIIGGSCVHKNGLVWGAKAIGMKHKIRGSEVSKVTSYMKERGLVVLNKSNRYELRVA